MGAVGLTIPGLRDPLDRVGLDVEDDLARGRVADEAQVLLAELVPGDREVGVAVELAHLAADSRRGQCCLRVRGLADLHEAPTGRGGLDRRGGRRAPERVDDVGGAVAARSLLECGHEVVFFEAHGRVGAELGRTLQTLGISADRDDALGAEELRSLRGDEPDSPGRAEHEHAVVLPHGRAPRDGHPARHPGNATGSCDLVSHRVWERDTEVGRCGCALRQQSVAREAEAVAEEIDARAVGGAADALAAGDVRKLGMAAEVTARADVDVDRVERDRRDLVNRLARGVRPVGELGWPTELADHRSSHRAASSR